MSHVRFNQVFIALVVLAGLCSFVAPVRLGDALRGNVDGIFAPVSIPIRKLADQFSTRFRPAAAVVAPDLDLSGVPEAAKQEIQRLRARVVSLSSQLADIEQIKLGRELVGDAAPYCAPFKVSSADVGEGHRRTLYLRGSAGDGLKAGQPVLYGDSVVGQVASVGLSGAQVKLVTDPYFGVSGQFQMFRNTAQGKQLIAIDTLSPFVEGQGASGRMVITNIYAEDAERYGIQVGDWVVLHEPDYEQWPLVLSGKCLGQIEWIGKQAKAPLFAEIVVRPRMEPSQLREVMVMTKPVTDLPRLGKPAPTPAQKAAPKAAVKKPTVPQKARPRTSLRGRG